MSFLAILTVPRQAFTAWCNYCMEGEGQLSIFKDLKSDFRNGTRLLALLDVLLPEKGAEDAIAVEVGNLHEETKDEAGNGTKEEKDTRG